MLAVHAFRMKSVTALRRLAVSIRHGVPPSIANRNPIQRGKATSTIEGGVSCVAVVPEVGTKAETTWLDGSSACWLKSLLPSILENSYVLEFRHSKPNDQFIWQYFARKGDVLAESLLELVQKTQLRSLIFICHGLGGLIVKKAIRRIYDEFHKPEFGKLFRALSGVVFLGCPHPKFGEIHDWPNLSTLLKEYMALPKKAMQHAQDSIATVANISKSFDESDLDLDILSVIEGKPTKVKGALFKRQILVKESLARTKLRHEKVVKTDSTHGALCNVLPGSPFYSQLSEFLTLAGPGRTPDSPIAITVTQSTPAWSVSNAHEDEERFKQLSVQTSFGISNINTVASSSDRSGYELIPGKPVTGIAKRLKLPSYIMGPHTPVPEFCGREDVLQQVRSALCSTNELGRFGPLSGLRTFAIYGAGGMGKTQVAVTFAYECKARKEFDAIFWIQASDTGKLAKSFADIALKLGLEDNSGDQVVSRDLVLEWLSYPTHQIQDGAKLSPPASSTPKWLLIFDNADELSILRDYWPISGGGAILVTSRDPLAKSQTYFQSDAGIELNPFNHEDALSLVRTLTGYSKPKDYELSAAIVKRLSYIPLAINQMAKTIKRRNMSLKEFIRYYEQAEMRQSFNKTVIGAPASGMAPRTIATVWSLDDLHPPAARLFDVISFMDPDQIQESLLTDVGETAASLSHYPNSLDSFLLARSELTGSSLLSRNVDTEELTTHRIIQDTNRLQMSQDHFVLVFDIVCQLLYRAWHFSEFDWEPTRWPKCEPVIAHVTYLGEVYKGARDVTIEPNTAAKLARLLMEAGWYYVERGLFKQSPPFFDLAEEVCKLAPQQTRITFADICYCRAELGNMENDPKTALPFAKQYLSLISEHDPKGWRLPQAHNIMAVLSLGTCDYEGSISHANLAIHLYGTLPVPEYVAFAYINKAYGLLLTGKSTEAEQVLESYLQGQPGKERAAVSEPYKAAYAQRLLGVVFRHQGRYAESLDMHQRAIKLLIDTTGEDFRVAEFHDQIGDTQRCLGQFEESKHSYLRAVTLWNESSSSLLEISRTYFKLSHICEELGNATEAADAKQNGNRILGRAGDHLTEEDIDRLLLGWSRI